MILFRHELRRLLGGGFFWWLLALACAAVAWLFFDRVEQFLHLQEQERQPGSVTAAVVMPVLSELAALLLALSAVLSLRGFADDRRLGTLALLRGTPKPIWQSVLAKWFGLATPLWVLLIIAVGVIATAAVGAPIDHGRVLAMVVGLFLLGLTAIALAVMVSCIIEQPVLVALLALMLLVGLWVVDLAPLNRGVADSPLQQVSLAAHLRPFAAGVIDSSALAYYLLLAVAALTLASVSLSLLDRRTRWFVGLAVLLAFLLCNALMHRFALHWDVSDDRRNSLTAPTLELLQQLSGPVEATVFVGADAQLRRSIDNFLQRYVEAGTQWQLTYVDPASEPERVRELNVRTQGELRLAHNSREETVVNLSEQSVTNALFRLARASDVFVGYSFGSGERDLRGTGDFDLGTFGVALAERGIVAQPVDLLLNAGIPENVKLLIVTQPRSELLPGVASAIRLHLQRGGNLLWLADPGPLHGLETLLDELRLESYPGVLVDAVASSRGQDPFAPVISRYGDHPLIRDFSMQTLFPRIRAWRALDSTWTVSPLIQSTRNSWNETGDLLGELGLDAADEQRGPLPLALALTRSLSAGDQSIQLQQRVVVVGDGDFLANRFIGNGGNLDLGLRTVDWLLADDRFVEVPARRTPDRRLQLSDRQVGWLAVWWQMVVPGLLALIGVWCYRRVRHA